MGHEFTGVIVEAGSGVKTVKLGDKIVSPFTTSCGRCFYCINGYSSRCSENLLFGCPKLWVGLLSAQSGPALTIFFSSEMVDKPNTSAFLMQTEPF